MRAFMATLLLATASPAQASPVCADGGYKQNAYLSGKAQGHKLVESAWANLGQDCAQQPLLESTVRDALDRLTPPAGSTDGTLCRYAGVEDGADEELADIATSCQ